MNFGYPTITEILPDMHGFYLIGHDDYHRGLGISSTQVKNALKSYELFNKGVRDTDALRFGRAFHAALLEPDYFAAHYAVVPNFSGHKNSKAHKSDKQTWVHSIGNKEMLQAKEAVQISDMLRAIKTHPEYAKLDKFQAEIMGITKCQETSLQIKCKSDLFASGIIDFKSTSTGVGPEFMKDVLNFGYHISAAFYQDIVAAIIGERLPFTIVAVTKTNSECEFWQLSDELLEEGRKLYKAGLRRIARWRIQPPENRVLQEKKIRVLEMTPRAAFLTQDILRYIDG
jgi:hypothetical protein